MADRLLDRARLPTARAKAVSDRMAWIFVGGCRQCGYRLIICAGPKADRADRTSKPPAIPRATATPKLPRWDLMRHTGKRPASRKSYCAYKNVSH